MISQSNRENENELEQEIKNYEIEKKVKNEHLAENYSGGPCFICHCLYFSYPAQDGFLCFNADVNLPPQ